MQPFLQLFLGFFITSLTPGRNILRLARVTPLVKKLWAPIPPLANMLYMVADMTDRALPRVHHALTGFILLLKRVTCLSQSKALRNLDGLRRMAKTFSLERSVIGPPAGHGA